MFFLMSHWVSNLLGAHWKMVQIKECYKSLDMHFDWLLQSKCNIDSALISAVGVIACAS